jgi:hypothetical protein
VRPVAAERRRDRWALDALYEIIVAEQPDLLT